MRSVEEKFYIAKGLLRGKDEEMQRKASRQGKSLSFSENTCLEKERMRSKMTPRKVGVGLKWRRELGWRLAWWKSTEKEASYLLGLRGRHQYSDQRASEIRALCVPSTTVGTEGEED